MGEDSPGENRREHSFNPNEWITLREAAARFGLSVETLKKACQKRKIAGQKHGNVWFVEPKSQEAVKGRLFALCEN